MVILYPEGGSYFGIWSFKMSVHFFLFSGSRIFHLVCLEIFNQQRAKDTTLCSMDQKTMCGQEV